MELRPIVKVQFKAWRHRSGKKVLYIIYFTAAVVRNICRKIELDKGKIDGREDPLFGIEFFISSTLPSFRLSLLFSHF